MAEEQAFGHYAPAEQAKTDAWVQEQVDPIFNQLLTELIVARPANVLDFMAEFCLREQVRAEHAGSADAEQAAIMIQNLVRMNLARKRVSEVRESKQ